MGRGWVWLSFPLLAFSSGPIFSLLLSCHVLSLACGVLSFACPFFPFLSCPFLLLLLGFSCPYLSLAPSLPFSSHFLPFPVLVLSFLCSSHTFSGFYHAVPYRPFLFVLSCYDCSLHPIASLSFSCLSFPPLSLLFPKSFSFSILPLSLSCSCSPPCLPCAVLSLSLPLFFVGLPLSLSCHAPSLSSPSPVFSTPCLPFHIAQAAAA